MPVSVRPNGVERASDPEVGHLRPPVTREQHVLRLHVAVDEPLRVGERQRLRHFEPQLERPPDRQRPAGDELLQVLPLDVLEDDELAAVGLAAVDHRDDAGVRELSDRTGLVPEALDVVVVARVVLVQELESDVSLEQGVVRAEHGRHAARADGVLELVAVGDELAHHEERSLPAARGARTRG